MKHYGLIGESLAHSFSKSFFTNYFRENDIDADYQNIELPNLASLSEQFSKFNGFNVTIPYKEAVVSKLDELSEEAKAIGAVNVIQIVNGKTIGHNTDAYGFHQSIKPFLTNRHERALILGTGGASKAVAYILRSLGIDVVYLSRNPKAANEFGYDEANEHMMNACKLIVNTTPVGTFPNVQDKINLPYEYLTDEHLLIDLIYNPEKTEFLKAGEANGATILNGHSMLRHQALRSYEIWTS
jgi:shikimate dehydrogenase